MNNHTSVDSSTRTSICYRSMTLEFGGGCPQASRTSEYSVQHRLKLEVASAFSVTGSDCFAFLFYACLSRLSSTHDQGQDSVPGPTCSIRSSTPASAFHCLLELGWPRGCGCSESITLDAAQRRLEPTIALDLCRNPTELHDHKDEACALCLQALFFKARS